MIALFLMFTALAVKLKWTNEKGDVDVNNRYFDKVASNYSDDLDSVNQQYLKARVFQKVGVLSNKYPKNAEIIINAFNKSKDARVAARMLDAIQLLLKDDKTIQKEFARINSLTSKQSENLYPWAHSQAWKDFCKAVANDKKAIDSVARMTGVEPRLLVMCLVGEQVRMFNSGREKFKQYVVPFSRLILPTNRGYGVTGILQNTALRIEKTLFDTKSPFYAGDYFQSCINVNDSFPELVNDTIESHKYKTIQRLIKGGDHYYSYLYTAFLIRQYQAHWEKAGFTLAYRPEIIGTLFNLGYQKSKPSAHPKVGGSNFQVANRIYTFGGLCYEFYYSGELQNLFPLTSKPIVPVADLEIKNKDLIVKRKKRDEEDKKKREIEEKKNREIEERRLREEAMKQEGAAQ
ncbi:MAG: hypothetical protein RLZZ531_2025 [Bacteroidota bacterium]